MTYKITAITCLITYFSCVNGMIPNPDSRYMELKSYSNANFRNRTSNEVLYPKVKRFEDALDLLKIYAQQVVTAKHDIIRSFQMKALDTSIESLTEALLIADIPVPEDPIREEVKVPLDVTLSASFIDPKELPSAPPGEAPSLMEGRRRSVIEAYKSKILEFKKLIMLMDEQKETIKASFLASADEEKKENFLSDIIAGIDAIRGIMVLIKKDESITGSSIMDEEKTDELSVTEETNNIEVTDSDFDDL